MTTLSENIKFYRKQVGLTQKTLAEKLGIAPTAVSAWELGRNKPLMDNIEQMSIIFGVKKSVLLGDDLTILSTPSDTVEVIPSTLQKVTHTTSQLEHKRQLTVLNFAENELSEQLEEQNTVENSKNIVADNVVSLDDYRKRVERSAPGKVSAGTGYWQEDDYDTLVSFYEDEIPDEDDYDTIAIVVGHSMEPKIKNGDFLFIKLTHSVDINQIGIFQVDGENYVKKLKNGYLESLNKDYDDIDFDDHDDIRTIGEVVSIYREK